MVMDDELSEAEKEDPEEAVREWLQTARNIVDDSENVYVALPDRHEVNEHGIMEQFISSLEDEKKRSVLASAIRGRDAF